MKLSLLNFCRQRSSSVSARSAAVMLVVILWIICVSCVSTARPPMKELSGAFQGWYAAEDINGSFPDAVYIKTRTQTFNSYHYYILKDGLIWYKSIDPAKKPHDWTLDLFNNPVGY